MRRNNVTAMFVLLSFVLVTFLIFSTDTQRGRGDRGRKFYPKINESFAEFDKCFEKESTKLTGDVEKMWVQIDKVITACDRPFTSYIKVEDYQNRDEVKRHVSPLKRSQGKDVIVTLGIGRDTEAEKKMLKALGADNVEFFGADPILYQNKDLYSKIGTYYPYAVGARSGNSTASVLEGVGYHDKVVLYMNIIEFLNEHIKRSFIDNLLLDVEYAEYDMLPFFYRGGHFDHEGIVFCQINAEIHSPSMEQKLKLKEFIFKIHEEKKYAMLKTINVGHLRLYMVNMEDERCIEKYILRT